MKLLLYLHPWIYISTILHREIGTTDDCSAQGSEHESEQICSSHSRVYLCICHIYKYIYDIRKRSHSFLPELHGQSQCSFFILIALRYAQTPFAYKLPPAAISNSTASFNPQSSKSCFALTSAPAERSTMPVSFSSFAASLTALYMGPMDRMG